MNKPKYIDIHSHINFAAYDEDRDEVVKRALESGTWMINVGTKKETSQSAVDLANKYSEGVYAIIGLHPIHANKSFHDVDEIGPEGKAFNSSGEKFDLDFYGELIKNPKVVGVGECGLDFFRIPEEDPSTDSTSSPQASSGRGKHEFIKKQRQAFGVQIELAAENDKPLMIHCRNAYTETLQILKVYKMEYGDKLRGNFHFFAGSLDEAKQILDLGFTLSFTGVITFTHDYDELVKFVPLDRIMSETDCPYVTPAPHRGKRNEPMYVSEVVKKIAEIKGLDEEEVREQLVENALNMFGIGV